MDMFTLNPISARLKYALEGAKAVGVDRRYAVALVALSEGETGGVWLTTRPGTFASDPSCAAVVVGLELSDFSPALLTGGGDQEAISWLQERGWIDADQSSPDFKLKPVNGLGNPLAPRKTMLYFEWVVATRKEHLLRSFSIGPTQLHLAWYGKRCGFPSTWEELWDLYTAGSTWELSDQEPVVTDAARIAYLMMRWELYLAPKSVYSAGCLSSSTKLPDGSEAVGVPWLQKHAGNTPMAKKVWDGYGNRRAYRDVWNEVNLLAEQIGY